MLPFLFALILLHLGYRYFRRNYFFLGWRPFVKHLKLARILNLTGFQGTGKTLFATALGYHLLHEWHVERAAFNFPVSFGDAPQRLQCFYALDEIGVLFDNRFSAKKQTASTLLARVTYNLRKNGCIIAAPSFLAVDKRLRAGMRISRIRSIGSTAWQYHWEMGEEDALLRRPGINYMEGSLWLLNPRFFFGVYDTHYDPPAPVTARFLASLFPDDPQLVAKAMKDVS